MTVSTVFLLLIIYTVGTAWAKFLPRRETVRGTRFDSLGSVFHLLNPGDFGIKEVSYYYTSSPVRSRCLLLKACRCVNCRIYRFWWQLSRHELRSSASKSEILTSGTTIAISYPDFLALL